MSKPDVDNSDHVRTDEVKLILTDQASATVTYVGRAVKMDAATSAAVWQISRTVVEGNVTTKTFADNGEYTQIWNNRASLFPAQDADDNTPESVFFFIPKGEITQRQVNLSEESDIDIADLETRRINDDDFVILEVATENSKHEEFLDYRAYTEAEAAVTTFVPAKSAFVLADNTGVLTKTTTTSGANTDTYTFSEDRKPRRIWFESETRVLGDSLTVEILAQSGKIRATPVNGWKVQLGITPFDFPAGTLLAGEKLRFTYTKATTGTSAYTINLEQDRVIAPLIP
jgi:hypothetical protein